MHMCTIISLQRWMLGSLVVIWLLMGGLALAEQLHVVSETGPHDEQALEHLQLAVKSEAFGGSTGTAPPDLLHLPIAVPPITIGTAVAMNLISSFLGSVHTRSLALFTCCFRI